MGRFGGPQKVPRTWKSPFEIRKEARLMAERMMIPECRSCGVKCSVCAAGGQFGKCCLETAESGETYDVEMASVKETKQ